MALCLIFTMKSFDCAFKLKFWYESYETPFLCKVDMSRRFCSFGVGFNELFYHALFREGSDKD